LIDDAAAMHPGKCITTKGGAEIWQDHHQRLYGRVLTFIEQPDNSEQQAEIQPRKAQISHKSGKWSRPTERARCEQQQLQPNLNEGNSTYRRLSDFKKGSGLLATPQVRSRH
jgi:hypothetical protein